MNKSNIKVLIDANGNPDTYTRWKLAEAILILQSIGAIIEFNYNLDDWDVIDIK